MALPGGTRLGPYEITSLLGAGGMGEVYRARDTRLDRSVAVKVLPEQFAKDEVRRERFEREARAVSGLNHPHICTLHDVGEQDGIHYLVMEHVEGEGLDRRLARGALPIREALGAARQIADALDKAHRQGVVHRDLKPGNIVLTGSGIKLLDFGLAKLKDAGGVLASASDPTRSYPTSSDRTQDGAGMLTVHGSIVGTLDYMAPEQLEGKDAGVGSDIFALGVLVYEMVTGSRPFRGDSSAQLIAAIMEKEPPAISDKNPAAPPALDHIVRRCLAKSPEARWQNAGDLMRELAWVEEILSEGVPAPPGSPRGRRSHRSAWLQSALVGVVAGAGLAFFLTRPAAPPEYRLEISTPVTVDGSMLAVSPDGRHVAFVANTENGAALFLRALSSTSAELLGGTEGAAFPFWSPDSQAIGFFANGQLVRINLASGLVQSLAAAPLARGGTWSGDTILYVPNPNGPVYRIPATGGTPVSLQLDDQAGNHYWPVFLPDGRHFLYFVTGSGVWVGDLDGSPPRRLLDENHSSAVWSPSGHLLFVRQGTLMAQAFDEGSLALRGNPFPLAEQVPSPAGHAAVSVAGAGPVVFRSGEAPRSLVRLDRQGASIGQTGRLSAAQTMSLSPDGLRVATGGADIWVLELGTSRQERVTSDPGADWMSIWSPDGRELAFASDRLGRFGIYLTASGGAGAAELLVERGLPTDWSRDGGFLLYRSSADPVTGDDIWAMPMDPPGSPFAVVQTGATERDAQFSPDGRWIAYESDRTGQFEIYLQRFPSPDRVETVSIGGGAQPRWNPQGNELFYIALDGSLMSVPMALPAAADGPMEIGQPRALFRTRIVSVVQQFRQQYSVFPDGQQFLMSVLPENQDMPPITVILNWAG
jgi:serine/threonine protein kinase/Tol biopolymer transport system component